MTTQPPNPGLPWRFGLRLAARLADYLLLLFALYLLAAGRPNAVVVGYLTLIIAFSLVNLRAISRAVRGDAGAGLLTGAHLLSAALPLTYVIGVWWLGRFDSFAVNQALAVTVPALLNWLAIETAN